MTDDGYGSLPLFDLCEAIPPAFAEYIGRSFLENRCAPRPADTRAGAS